MKKRFYNEESISMLREAEAGVSARELCRKKYGGMKVTEVKRLK
jgi:putative transposase